MAVVVLFLFAVSPATMSPFFLVDSCGWLFRFTLSIDKAYLKKYVKKKKPLFKGLFCSR